MAALWSLFLFTAGLLAAYGIGRFLLPRSFFRNAVSVSPETTIFQVAAGMGGLAYLTLVFGLLRLANAAAFGVLLGILAGVGAVVAVRGPRGPKKQASAPANRPPWELGAAVALGLLALLTALAALAPPSVLEWDSLAYHLAVPKTYLAQGRIFYIPYDHHSNFPFTLEMLFLLMLGLGSVGAAKLFHWVCGALLVLSIYTFAARHIAPTDFGKRTGLVAALLAAGTPILLWEASIAYIDLSTALFTWLSLYALVNAAQSAFQDEGGAQKQNLAWLWVSALMMGFALGTKLTVLAFWGMLLVGVLGWHFVTTRRWAKETIPHAALWAGVSLLVGLPWYLKTWLYTGNPVYPFFYNLFGGRYWNAENAALYAGDQGRFGLGKTPVDLLLGPWQATMEPLTAFAAGRPFVFTEYTAFGLSPALLALFLAAPLLVGRRSLSRASVYLALFALGVYVFWFFLMQQTRYLIPAVPALAIVGAEALLHAWEERRRAVGVAGGLLIAASLVWSVYLTGTQLTAPALPFVLGQIAPADYPAQQQGRLGRAVQWINENTPKEAKVALFDEPRAYYLDRAYLWAQPNHAVGLLPWDTYRGPDDWLADFKRRGYTILLVNEANASPLSQSQRWYSLLSEAIADNKVTLAFETGGSRGVKVYQIP
ncbi:MAG: glycosyltransferase family 39 protein [Cytophagales bacterium]|nr:glycosyltransferase family 39 protein [Armatimonadota bacterium]